MVEEEQEQDLFRDYVGQCLWDIDNGVYALFGQKNDMPQYVELIHKDTKKPKEMTADEIKQYVLDRLG